MQRKWLGLALSVVFGLMGCGNGPGKTTTAADKGADPDEIARQAKAKADAAKTAKIPKGANITSGGDIEVSDSAPPTKAK